ncbi:MAG TPA: cupredoxin domain-containing protein [Solirubrobacterales bacterium]
MKPPRYVLISPVLMLSLMALALFAGLAGCGSSGGGSTSASSTAAGPKAVTIKNYAFAPADLTVAKGATVKFSNDDSTNHTATATDSSALDTGTIAPGKSKTVSFETPGTFQYFCAFHPFMKGTITVTG